MSDAVQVALIAGLLNVLAIVVSRMITARENNATQKVVARIDMSVNGRLDQLLKLTEKSSRAEGVKEGKREKS